MELEQIARRRKKALEEGFRVRNTRGNDVFSRYQVHSPSGRTYEVSLRSLTARINGCSCPDYLTNMLGTCKHIEAVLVVLEKKLGKRLAAVEKEAPATAEVYLRHAERVEVRLKAPQGLRGKVRKVLERFFDGEGVLVGDAAHQVTALLEAAARLDADDLAQLNIAADVLTHAEVMLETAEHRKQRDWFLEEVRAGRRSLELVGTKLYPYQVEGMLHLAFTGRALLADDMGLGKTVQAIGAAALLKELRGIERVLVVTPASLKHQWKREIQRFTSLGVEVVDGAASKRDLAYKTPAFFTVVNYELLLKDAEVFHRLAPDLVILDEAQRVKNWRTQTAQAVKALASRFAFVLTGTPLENNLDELYSVLQVVDPRLLGPLWQFNSRYFQLERRKSGSYRVNGYKNLEELRQRIRPVLIRRTRDEVLTDLPPRVDNNFFVPMTKGQTEPYLEHHAAVARLCAIAERRPLSPQESKRLFSNLQSMRILCDALELHDQRIPEKHKKLTAPKIDELAGILQEQVVEGGRKAVIFSSFEGMIDLAIRRAARPLKIGHVKLAGSVPTAQRGALLDRFRLDPKCMVFFSTDAGGVGLNLQDASLVINLDLPWNPAVLEQRIGRAHRMGQKASVQVINLISRGTIEEKMLDTLAMKRQVFQAVFSALDGVDALEFGKNHGLMARLRQLLTDEAPPQAPAELPPAVVTPVAEPTVAQRTRSFADRLAARLGGRLLLVRPAALPGADLPRLLVVVDRDPAELASVVDEVAREAAGASPAFSLHLFDRHGFEGLAAFLGATLPASPDDELFRSPALPAPAADGAARAATALLDQAAARLRLARLMATGGFASDAAAPLKQALDGTLQALYALAGDGVTQDKASPAAIEQWLVRPGILDPQKSTLVPWIQGLLATPDAPVLDAALVDRLALALEDLAQTGRTRVAAAAIGS